MNTIISINSFQATVELPVQLKSKLTNYCNGEVHNHWVLINLEHGMCTIGYMQSWDGGQSHQWCFSNTHGVRDTKNGLQYFDQGMGSWRHFDDGVQEEYARYMLEKELK